MRGKEASENKGYAFVSFRTKELPSTAIKELNKSDLKSRRIKCPTYQAKHKLFIGNVHKKWTPEDMENVVGRVGPGTNSVELLKDPQNSRRTCGPWICFHRVLYYYTMLVRVFKTKYVEPKF